MATGTAARSLPPRRAEHEHELVEYGRYIDQQLSKTARQVRGVDIASGLMGWLAGSLAYLMLAAAADHWLFSSGLGLWGRWLALLGLIGGGGWFLARSVLPMLVHRINPVYSAHTIERGRPQLKNSLVNFLLLRSEPRELPELVRDALQSQAANGLAAAPVEKTLDRTPLVRFALVLLGSVVIAALYIMFSPKDPLRSAARVMLPWASIDRPTRFAIENLQVEVVETGRKFTGGKAEVFYGQRVKISASVLNRGHIASEPLVLRFTTADGAAENQALTLEARERSADIILPAGTLAAAVGGGLQQSLDYTLTAGDAIAGPFRIEVLAAPSIEIESLEYDYPDYTRLPSRTLQGQGDVSALEGTRVIVRAVANQDILQAWLDLSCDGRRDGTMQAKGREAGVNFLLALAEDRRTPAHASYLLRFENTDGFENPQPIRYQIDVTPDLAPEIAWESPREVDVPRELPVDEALELVLTAGDRDFDLAKVTLRVELETDDAAQRRPWEQTLLSAPRSGKWTSELESFVAGEHGFRAGETILIWGEAADNRRPKPNLAETPKLTVTLLPPRDATEKQGPNHQPNDGSGEPPPAGKEKQPDDDDAPRQQRQERGKQGKESSQEDKQSPRNGDKDQQDQQQTEKQRPGDNKNQQGEKEPPEQDKGDDPEQAQGAGEKQQAAGEQQPGEKGEQSAERQGGGESSEPGAGQQGDQQGKGAGNEAESPSGSGKNGRQGEPSRQGHSSGQKTGQEQGSGEEGGEPKPGEPNSGQPTRRVDPDAQDGDAFERMMEHFQKQQEHDKAASEKPSKNQPSEQSEQDANKQQPDGSSDGDDGEPAAEKNAQGKEGQSEQGAAERSEQPGIAQGDEKQPGAKSAGEKPDEQVAQEGGAKGETGENGEQERAGQDQPQSPQEAKAPTEQQEPGNNQPSTDNQTSPGAGQKNQEESAGAPEAQGANRQRDKQGKTTEPEKREGKDEPQSPSQSKQHSDSEGGEAGDESGGGGEGGGQNADQEGTGSAGSNTEADDGSGAAEQSGDGETDGRGGDDRESKGNTGDPNAKSTQGQGKRGQDGEPADKSQQRSGERGEQPAGDQAASQDQPKQPEDQSRSSTSPGKGTPNGSRQSPPSKQASESEPQGGGEGSDQPKPPQARPPQPEPGGDAANRDFADRATDLVLDRLKDQLKKGQPDEGLLDKLQWTKQDLERFVNRWDQMKAAAKQSGATGKKAQTELDQALKSLGLRPRGTKLGAGQSRQDDVRGNRDSRRSEPPAEYAEQYRQFNVGTSKGK